MAVDGSGGSGAEPRRGADPVDALGSLGATLRDRAVWSEPPVGLVDTIIAAARSEAPAVVPTGEPASSPVTRRYRGDGLRWRMAAAAAVAAGVFAGGFLLGTADDDEPEAQDDPLVAQLALVGTDLAPDAAADVAVFDRGAGFALILDTTGLEPAPAGSYYQGWLRSPTGEEVSVGTFHMRSGDDSVVLWSGVAVAEYPTLVVTHERVEGAGAGDTIMVGTLVRT